VPFEKLQPAVVSPTSPVKAPVFAIVIHEKGGSERREIFETTEISVGRVQGNDLMLPKGNVSKRHARMLYRDGRFIVTDLNSTNGTYVNRRRITQATIVREGDRIYIGDFVLRIESPGVSALPVGEQSVHVNANSAPPAARAPMPTAGDSQSGALLRSAFDEDEEHTRSAPRGTGSKSSPAAAEPQALPNRTTQEDDEFGAGLERELIGTLVDRAARGFPNGQLERNLTSDVVERIEHSLREAWTALGAERGGALQFPPERIVAAARAELCELGPLGELLDDPAVTEIAVIGGDRISVVRSGKASVLDAGFSSEHSLRWAVQRLCTRGGIAPGELGARECRLTDGTSIAAVVTPGSPALVLIRKPRRLAGSLDELVRRGTVSRALATFLQQCLVARINILIVGPRDGGTEILLGALAAAVPDKELVFAGDFEAASGRAVQRVRLEGPAEDVARAVGLAARAPTLRLAVELGSPVVTEAVLGAIADGADGVIALRSASSLGRGLLRLRADLGSYTEGAARALLAGTFEVVVEVARLRDDRHRVLRVAEIADASEASLELADVFTFVMDRTAAGGMIEGSFVPAATMPAITDMLRSRGATLDSSLFSRPPSR
jgi:pilus assembly protein CpaF